MAPEAEYESEQEYEVAWTPAARRGLHRLPEKVATAAVELIHGTLASNPQRVGKALRFEFAGLHSARRGDYRVIYRLDARVTIVAIDHRADVCR